MIEFSEELVFAKKAAEGAGKIIMGQYKIHAYEFSLKEDKTEVTKADFLANESIMENLKNFNYPFITEETQFKTVTPDKTWIIDPLDGTRDFIKRGKDFCTMIGLLENGIPVLGVVFAPALGKMYFAQKGGGATLEENGESKRIRVSKSMDSNELKFIVSLNHFSKIDGEFIKYSKIRNFVKMGSAGLKICSVAEGLGDVYFNFDGLSIWDLCAPQVILEQAGGKIVDLKGSKFVYDRKRFSDGIIAYNNNAWIIGKIREFLKKRKENNGKQGRNFSNSARLR